MKKLITTFMSGIAMLILIVPVTFAQTPDGQTPAEETVCDPLQVDGITKGLYGLCVAFCEAQDHAGLYDAFTEADLDALEADAPSGRILASYNKKVAQSNNGIDPPMPCILVEEPCPCWSDAELLTIDGIIDGAAAEFFFCSQPGDDTIFQSFTESNITDTLPIQRHTASSFIHPYGLNATCHYQNIDHTRQPPRLIRFLSTASNTLTQAQAASCFAQVKAACLYWGK